MKVLINNNESSFDCRKVVICVNEDIEFEIRLNQFNELVINKGQFGKGETALIIKPHVANEILIS